MGPIDSWLGLRSVDGPPTTDDPCASPQMATDESCAGEFPTEGVLEEVAKVVAPTGAVPQASPTAIAERQDRRCQGHQFGPPVRHDLGRHLRWRHARRVAPQQCRLGVVVRAQEEVGERDPGRVREIPEHFGDAVRLVRPPRRASGREQVEARETLWALGRDGPRSHRVEVVDREVTGALQECCGSRCHHVAMLAQGHTKIGDDGVAQ